MIENGRELGLAILKALGVDPHNIRGFELRCFTGDMATLRIERFVDVVKEDSTIDSAFRHHCLGKVVKSELIEIESKIEIEGKEDVV